MRATYFVGALVLSGFGARCKAKVGATSDGDVVIASEDDFEQG